MFFADKNNQINNKRRCHYEKVCLCLAFVLAAVCILCSCSDLPASSTSETVNPSVDVTLKKWEDCGASIDKAEEISGIKFGESLKNIVSVRAIPYTAIEVVCSLDKSASDNTVTLRKAVSYAVKTVKISAESIQTDFLPQWRLLKLRVRIL